MKNNDFTPDMHIRKRAEFLQLQKKSKKVSAKNFLVTYAPSLVVTTKTRLGIVATTKIGNAVIRNRAKRLIREAFRRNKENFPQGLDIVIICYKGIHQMTQSDIDQDMILTAKKVKCSKQ